MGRPLGKKSTMKRFRDYVSEEEAVKLIYSALRLAQSGDKDMMKYCLDHYLGKAPQEINISDNEYDSTEEIGNKISELAEEIRRITNGVAKTAIEEAPTGIERTETEQSKE